MTRFLTTLSLFGLLIPASPAVALVEGWDDRAAIERDFAEFNATLPETEDGLRWDFLILEESVIIYHFTVLEELTEADLFFVRSEQYKQALAGLGCELGPEPFAAGYTFRIIFVTNTGNPLLDFTITEKDCL